MRKRWVARWAVAVLACVVQYPQEVRAEPPVRAVDSETTKIAWVWTPDYARRFGLPESESKLKEGAVKAIGLRVSRVEAVGQLVRYWCSIELIADGTQNYLFYGVRSHSNQLYENVDLKPGLITLNEDSKTGRKARLEDHGLPAYLGFIHADRKKGRYISTRYRLFRKDFLDGLQYISLSTGCMYEFPRNGFQLVLFVAHADYRGSQRIYEDPKNFRIEIPNSLVNRMQGELMNANTTNTEYVKVFDKQYKSKSGK